MVKLKDKPQHLSSQQCQRSIIHASGFKALNVVTATGHALQQTNDIE